MVESAGAEVVVSSGGHVEHDDSCEKMVAGARDVGSSCWQRDGGCGFWRRCDGVYVRRAATIIGRGRAAMEDDDYGVWRL